MLEQTIISIPSIAETNVLFSSWKLIPGNENRTMADFYRFLSVESIDRTVFIGNNTTEKYTIRGNIVVLKVFPK